MTSSLHGVLPPSFSARPGKLATAREANKPLKRTGEPFWQKESYDHWVRNQAEFERITAYIENNPVKAGLVQLPQDYRWSSAGVEKSLDAARTRAYATYKLAPYLGFWNSDRPASH